MSRDFYKSLRVMERRETPLAPEARLAAAGDGLLHWYRENRRILPWREDPAPYRVWISEIMLQQTRVEAVKPYFARFMKALPDIPALARVREERLLKLWEGLGYYTRARNLKKAAGILDEKYGGKMPASYQEILALPGVGSYTAGAIASIAFGLSEPAVDGNVLRVMTRLFADPSDISKPATKKYYEGLLRGELLRRSGDGEKNAPAPSGRETGSEAPDRQARGGQVEVPSFGAAFSPGEFNQAFIELGALVCQPAGRPLCGDCPLEALCLARREERQAEFPVKAVKKPRRIEERTVFVIEWQGKAAIRRRENRGLLASLYEFPNLEGRIKPEEAAAALGLDPQEVEEAAALPDSVHIFSHVEWHMTGCRLRLRREHPELFKMVDKEEIFSKYPLPSAFGAYTNVLM